jgi:neutrophil factor 2
MSLKNELLIYQAALEAFDTHNLSLALTHFGKISETSKIQWNMGIILATMGRHNEAIARFGESIVMDQYLVVGWFQRGVSYFVSPLHYHYTDGRW